MPTPLFRLDFAPVLQLARARQAGSLEPADGPERCSSCGTHQINKAAMQPKFDG